MIEHCSVEMLSGYLDGVLPDEDAGEVETHIGDCPECRQRLHGLQRVVAQLRRLEQVPAPATLGGAVHRSARLGVHDRRLTQELEQAAGRWLRPPVVAPLFALVLAFGVILYLLSVGVYRNERSATRVIVPATDAAVSTETDETRTSFTAGDRRFERSDGVWREAGVGNQEPVRTLDLRQPAAREELPEDLRDLLSLRGEVVAEIEGQVVRVLLPAGS